MVRLSGMGRLAVLLAVVVAALSFACAGDAAELTSTDIPNTGTPIWPRPPLSPPAG